MSAGDSVAAAGAAPGSPKSAWFDLAAIAICTLAWGTTWYAITLQLGAVDPIVSLVYRFGSASLLLFAWCALRREPSGLTRSQHAAALGMGLCNFLVNYVCVYWAEERVNSAVVAIVFASMAFVNLVTFRIALAQRASAQAWLAAGLGVVGVAILSWNEVAGAAMNAGTLAGIGLVILGVVFASCGNLFARRGDLSGASVAAFTAWGMGYGALALTLLALATGKVWEFEPTWEYSLSLLHLSVNGSVIAFLMYFMLARRRGYAVASYTSALTPLVAMAMSSLFEAKIWGAGAFAGIALVLAGQVLLLRTKRS
jgi:drug/metabolite transporter (DMT)-like permease